MSNTETEQTMTDTNEIETVYVVAETNAETTGVGIVGVFDNEDAAESAAENKRDDDLHGQYITSYSASVKSVYSPHGFCENETCQGDSRDDTQEVRWGSEELELCDSCIDFYESEIEVLCSDTQE